MIRRLLTVILAWTALVAGPVAASRIVAVGDVHGEIEGLDTVLRKAGLVDQSGSWAADAVLVQTGDLTDRGAEVRAVLDRVRELEAEAPARGGRVVALLGNHEVANLVHRFDFVSTPRPVYQQIWAAFAGKDSERRQRAAYRQWRRWHQRYPGCVEQENTAWATERKAWLADHPPGYVEYVEALSAGGEYGAWLRGLGVAAEIEGVVFLHGGLSPQLIEKGYRSVTAINEAAADALAQLDEDRRQLADDEIIVPFSSLWETHCALYVEMARLEQKGRPEDLARHAELAVVRERLPGTAGWFLDDPTGPVWFRGLAPNPPGDGTGASLTAEEVDGILQTFGAERMVVGHTPQPGAVVSRFDGRVFLIDTAMAYPELGGRAAALELDGGRVTAIYGDERVVLAEPEVARAADGASGVAAVVWGSPGDRGPQVEAATQSAAEYRTWIGPDGEPLPFAGDEEILEFLDTAKVIKSSPLGTGVTLPRKLLLERDGVRAHAIFHDVQIEKRRERLRGGQVVMFFRDHHANNIAAFELGRLLGMTNVPPAVRRKVHSKEGSVQMWIENAMTEDERRAQSIPLQGAARAAARNAVDDMWVFDNLIYNFDRNQGNILFDSDWNIWFIDHTRAFNRLGKLPNPERVKRCSVRLFQAVQELDEAETRARLKPYLGTFEIKAIFARRDLLIELLEAKIREQGAGEVLFSYAEQEAGPGGLDAEIPAPPPDG